MKYSAILLILPALVFLVGCEVPKIDTGPVLTEAELYPDAQPDAEGADANEGDTTDAGAAQQAVAGDSGAAEPREVTATDPTKGKKSREAGGYLGAVAASRFYAEHKIIFGNVTKAVEMYKATNGEFPQSHEEFEEKIIQANQIKLPDLDPGMKYVFDPADGKLKIYDASLVADEGEGPATDDSLTPLVGTNFYKKNKRDFDFVVRVLEERASTEGYPESHEVFWEEIIERYTIDLPNPPAGSEYAYDPSDHQLKLRKTN